MTFKLNPFHQTFQDHLKQWLTPKELASWNRYNDAVVRFPFVSHRWEPEDWALWEEQQDTIRRAMTGLELKAMRRKAETRKSCPDSSLLNWGASLLERRNPERHAFPCDCEICQSRWVGADENGET